MACCTIIGVPAIVESLSSITISITDRTTSSSGDASRSASVNVWSLNSTRRIAGPTIVARSSAFARRSSWGRSANERELDAVDAMLARDTDENTSLDPTPCPIDTPSVDEDFDSDSISSDDDIGLFFRSPDMRPFTVANGEFFFLDGSGEVGFSADSRRGDIGDVGLASVCPPLSSNPDSLDAVRACETGVSADTVRTRCRMPSCCCAFRLPVSAMFICRDRRGLASCGSDMRGTVGIFTSCDTSGMEAARVIGKSCASSDACRELRHRRAENMPRFFPFLSLSLLSAETLSSREDSDWAASAAAATALAAACASRDMDSRRCLIRASISSISFLLALYSRSRAGGVS
eukprot:Opistho-2@14583